MRAKRQYAIRAQHDIDEAARYDAVRGGEARRAASGQMRGAALYDARLLCALPCPCCDAPAVTADICCLCRAAAASPHSIAAHMPRRAVSADYRRYEF